MKTRKINFTVEFEDSDLIEHNLLKFLNTNLGASIIDYQVLIDSKELYKNDEHFKKLSDSYFKAKRERNDYLHRHK